jgi:GR25 family glycosyltransferase involved in LPS biosynthesis
MTQFIQSVHYINIGSDVSRKNAFLENFALNGLDCPLHRVEGVVPESGIGFMGRGEYGCAMSHIKVLETISKQPDGWYLVCEDDCTGDFRQIEKKTNWIRTYHPLIQYINLRPIPFSTNFCPGTRAGMVAYLVTPVGAKICKSLIRLCIGLMPCDMALCRSPVNVRDRM